MPRTQRGSGLYFCTPPLIVYYRTTGVSIMFLHITNAVYITDYKIDVLFNNGRKGIADLAPEYVYFQAFKNEEKLKPQFKEWGYIF
jgi:hypothetical protein